MIAWWWLFIAAWVGAGFAVLACSLSMAAHQHVPSLYLLGRCPDCGQAVFEGDECIVRHMDCPDAGNVTPIETAG